MHAKKGIHAFVCSTDYIRRYKHVAPKELFFKLNVFAMRHDLLLMK